MDINNLYALILGYGLGSIPFGLLIAHFAGHGDIRKIGSGNIGATNVLRTGSKKLAILTLLLDMAKAGGAAVLAAYLFGFTASLIAGGAALFGHCYPVWLKFKGGKGVAAYFGVLLAVSWPLALMATGLWLLSAVGTRLVSLSGIVTAITIPVAAYFMGQPQIAILSAVLGAIIILRHRENISRILAGTEPKIGAKKT
ncbi:MAG: acyl-phosphate glycerol 3-phosphate acyltransferase [Robiginitomaculum sp.]|nr:MAG: acyl-phosphate glycerol 3-phosphate acyltransferase [Robiginitomaculum sp.]